jgi:hypothetical protein
MAIGSASVRSSIPAVAALGVIVIVGGLLRGLGLRFGDPYVYHPDEWMLARHAMTMVATSDWNPHSFAYPSLLIELHAGLIAVMNMAGFSHLALGQSWLYESEFPPVQFPYILAGRTLVALTGIGTILVVFETGRRLVGVAGGLASAAILAVLPLAVEHAHYLTTDVPVAFLCAVCALTTVIAVQSQRTRWWILAGLAAGLAGSTKWNGLLVVGVPLLAYVMGRLGERPSLAILLERESMANLGTILVAAVVGLVVATPALVLAPNEVAAWLSVVARLYAVPDPRQTEGTLVFNLSALVAGFGPVLGWCVIGMAVAVRKARADPPMRVALTIPAFIVAYLVFASLPPRHYERNLLPILPYLAISGGIATAAFLAWARSRRLRGSPRPRLATGLVAIGLAACLVVPAAASAEITGAMRRPDTRLIARAWMLDHVPRGTRIAREVYTPQFSTEYARGGSYFLFQHTLEEYRTRGVRYLIASSRTYSRFVDMPDSAEETAFYRGLFALPEVFRVDPGPDRRGPTIRIFRLDPIGG